MDKSRHKLCPGAKTKYKRTAEYNSWIQARNRCNNPDNADYRHYGGRGISVCRRWDSFAVFLKDMGARPKDTSLERVDCDGGYSPANCVWADKFAQANNRHNNTKITHRGKTQGLLQWARESGVSIDKLRHRLAAGLPMEEVFSLADRARGHRGMSCPTRKLNGRQVVEIRKSRASGATLKELAVKYAVSQGAISLASSGKTWASI